MSSQFFISWGWTIPVSGLLQSSRLAQSWTSTHKPVKGSQGKQPRGETTRHSILTVACGTSIFIFHIFHALFMSRETEGKGSRYITEG